MSEQGFFMTPVALDKAKQQMSRLENQPLGLRVGVMGSGCNGMNYKVEWAYKARETDNVFEFDGFKVYVDPKSFVYLSGSTLGYEVNIMGHGFKFENPNVKSTCGCGSSFTV